MSLWNSPAELADTYLMPRFMAMPKDVVLAKWAKDISIVSVEQAPSLSVEPEDLALDISALMWREDDGGVFLTGGNEKGTGDGGHGRGLMQIDDRTHGVFLAKKDPVSGLFLWQIAYHNMTYAVQNVYGPDLIRFGYDRKNAFSAYNRGWQGVLNSLAAGQDPDVHTTGHDYGKDVLARRTRLLNAA